MNVSVARTMSGFNLLLMDGDRVVAKQVLDNYKGKWIAHSHQADVGIKGQALLFRALARVLRAEGATHVIFTEEWDSPMRAFWEKHNAAPVTVTYRMEI